MLINAPNNFTHGCEHELADWNASTLSNRLPAFSRDIKDITIVNSNGVGNDPLLKSYIYGGEINTPPSDTIYGQCSYLSDIIQTYPEATINYRSNLHWHIRIPGLKENLSALKAFARYNLHWLPKILPLVEPIPNPKEDVEFRSWSELEQKGALRRYKRRRRSHQTLLTPLRVSGQLTAKTIDLFFEREVPQTQEGKPMWHAQPRAAVNLRQLLQTDTVEFRHFPGTLDPDKLAVVGLWCDCYAKCALSDWGWPEEVNPVEEFIGMGGNLSQLPEFEPYDHRLEIRYRATCQDNSLHRHQVEDNIHDILSNTFDDDYWELQFKW